MIISSPVIVLISKKDEAGMNMYSTLHELKNFSKIEEISIDTWPDGKYQVEYEVDNEFCILLIENSQIYTDYLKGHLECSLVIFASKHSSKAGMKAILAHPLANWDKSLPGSGLDHSVGYVDPFALFSAYHALKKHKALQNLDNFWLGLEVSHHGPTELDVPAIFLEAGGTVEEWRDKLATKVVAHAILETIDTLKFRVSKHTAIGIGGGHYAPSIIKRVDVGLFHIGHMVPKFHTEILTPELLTKAWEKTLAENKFFLLDKKGLKGSVRRQIIEMLEELNYPYALTSEYPVCD